MSLFCSLSAPKLLDKYEAQNAPVLHVHTTLCSDALVVGIALSHGILTGPGWGWSSLEANPATEGVPEQEAVTDWEAATEDALARLTSSATYEAVEGKNEAKWVFLRQRTVDRLVKRVKDEVKDSMGGKEYVSTGCPLCMAAHADEALSRPNSLISAAALYHSPSLLSTHTSPSPTSTPSPDLTHYPHNAAIPPRTLLLPTSASSLSSLPLPDLALQLQLHRQVARYRTLQVLKTSAGQMKRAASSSSSAGGMLLSVSIASFSLPHLSLLAFYLASEAAGTMDHVLPLQQLAAEAGGGRRSGVTMSATMRRERWDAVERAMRELDAEAQAELEVEVEGRENQGLR
ncbi:hypothetical protein JCM11251_001343 [Rhodosporidiobolus azoricus]